MMILGLAKWLSVCFFLKCPEDLGPSNGRV